MTTSLAGAKIRFLPFNRGNGTAAGNPPVEAGNKTAYLWEQVWARDSLMDILARYLHLQVEEKKTAGGKTVRTETMIFPRHHQLDCVHACEADARARGAGCSYLIQHSAGSGKSNSTAWLAHRLASLHSAADEKVFDPVVVVTDRHVLDKQLQDTICQFEHRQGVVQRIDEDWQRLADALGAAVPIVVTTLQKFPFVTKKIGELPARRYAVIVDEAHSSQGGESAAHLRGVLAGRQLAQEVELSTLIELINERFGTSFSPADELFFSQIREEAMADEALQQAAAANTLEAFKTVFEPALESLFIGRMERNETIAARFLDDADFRGAVSRLIMQQVRERCAGRRRRSEGQARAGRLALPPGALRRSAPRPSCRTAAAGPT